MDAERERLLREKISELLSVPDEARCSELGLEIDALSPDPEWSDHIFYSEEYCDEEGNIDMDRLIAKLKQYRPIVAGWTEDPEIDSSGQRGRGHADRY